MSLPQDSSERSSWGQAGSEVVYTGTNKVVHPLSHKPIVSTSSQLHVYLDLEWANVHGTLAPEASRCSFAKATMFMGSPLPPIGSYLEVIWSIKNKALTFQGHSSFAP